MLTTSICSALFIVIASAFHPDDQRTAAAQKSASELLKAETNRQTVVDRLASLSFIVGDWKGVAQPKRGSNSGAWSEKIHAVWHFEEKYPCFVMALEPGQRCSQIVFAIAAESGQPIMMFHLSEQPSVMLELTESLPSTASNSTGQTNRPPQNSWAFESAGEPRIRVTVRKINDLRMALLFEESTNAKAAWRRQYEIGMTREGERLADGNTGERECVVTGGLGTIFVTHKEKTFFVCCEGCKQAFEADPEGTIAAYRERLKAKSKPPNE